ncbi:MAG TPA: flagellar hook-basal body protein [Burkholderiaceae bacterium]
MQPVLAIALTGMQEDMNHLDRVAQNMTNMATPGYKREVQLARPFTDMLDDLSAAADGAVGADVGAAMRRPLVLVDTSPGSLKDTGRPLDLALSGDGFFEISTPQGLAYTREGDFAIDAQGRLVTNAGDPVMGKGGEIHLATRTPRIDAAGNVTEPDAPADAAAPTAGAPVAQLRIVRFGDTRGMSHLGRGLLSPGQDAQVLDDATARVHQGALEASNTNTMQEMVQVIQTMRHFESMQKVAQGYDDLLGTAIQKLGELS